MNNQNRLRDRLDTVTDQELCDKLTKIAFNIRAFMSPKQLCRTPDYVNFDVDFITPADWVNNYNDTVSKYIADNCIANHQVTNRDKPIGCIHLEYDRIWLDAHMDTQIICQMMERNLQMFRDLNPNIPVGSICDTLAITYNYIHCGRDSNMVP